MCAKLKAPFEVHTTGRGFGVARFVERNGHACSIQESSIADESCLWLGVDDPNPQYLKNGEWRSVDINEAVGFEVHLHTRMHLTVDMAKQLIPLLQRFVDTGGILP